MGEGSCLSDVFTLSLSYVGCAWSWLAYIRMLPDSTYAVIGCNNFASWIFSNTFDCTKKVVQFLAGKTFLKSLKDFYFNMKS